MVSLQINLNALRAADAACLTGKIISLKNGPAPAAIFKTAIDRFLFIGQSALPARMFLTFKSVAHFLAMLKSKRPTSSRRVKAFRATSTLIANLLSAVRAFWQATLPTRRTLTTQQWDRLCERPLSFSGKLVTLAAAPFPVFQLIAAFSPLLATILAGHKSGVFFAASVYDRSLRTLFFNTLLFRSRIETRHGLELILSSLCRADVPASAHSL